MKLLGYYPSWATYNGYKIDDIPLNTITHLTYCFVTLDSDNALPCLGDPWADVGNDQCWPIRKPTSGNLYDFCKYKKSNPSVQGGISIGGWGCKGFSKSTSSATRQEAFVARVIEIMSCFGFDYVEVDWEFPQSANDHHNLVLLVQELKKSNIQVFLSLPCSLEALRQYDFEHLNVDYYVLMGYELSGTWSPQSSHHSNLYNVDCSGVCVDDVVKYLLTRSVDSTSLFLGIPFYGKRFVGCNSMGCAFKSVESVDFSQIHHYSACFNGDAVCSYCKTNDSLVVFDCPQCVAAKAKYAQNIKLAGIACWDLSKDDKKSTLLYSIIVKANTIN